MPKVKKGETEKHYVKRCVKERQGKENKKEKPAKSEAICHELYDKKTGKKKKSKKSS